MTVTLDPPARRKLNWWVESVTDAWLCATITWESEREAVAIGYQTEMEEFEATHPRPRLKDFMVHLSSKRGAAL